jgi:virginiamycin B lyase
MKNNKVCAVFFVLLGFFAFFGGTASPQAPSKGYIYWANYFGRSIGRATIEGTESNRYFFSTNGFATGVVVNDKYLYWSNEDISRDPWVQCTSIGRANLDGTDPNPNFITGCWRPLGLAIDEKYIYWVNREEWDVPLPDPSYHQHTIGRAKLDGSEVNQAFIDLPYLFMPSPTPRGIAVTKDFIYWGNYATNSIGRANLDGSGINEYWITSCTNSPHCVLVTETHIYWTNFQGGNIARANLDGTNPEIWLSVGDGPVGIAGINEFIYWGGFFGNSIGRGNLDKSDINFGWISPSESCWQVTLTPQTVKYDFEGFFSPIENSPVVNKANAAQAIPVKWRITDKNGLPISDPASFINITSCLVDCSSFADDPTNYVEEVAAGSSGLQYIGNGWWQFNWKTPKTYKGQCRTMKLTLDDKTEHTASFSFK